MSYTRRTLMGLFAAASMLAMPHFAAAEEGKLLIGSYPSNPPFEFKNESGTFEGFEAEIAAEVAKRLNLTPEFSDLGFQALFAATSSKRIDVAISSITITKERLGNQSFSQPYYDSDMGIATKADGALASEADLKGKTVGVLSGSTGEKWSNENKDKLGITEVKGYNAQQDMLLDLKAGRIDAGVSDVPGMQYAFLKMPDLAVKARIKTGEQYGLMMTKDHPLLDKINGAITEMKKDGTMAAIHKKWFGTDAPADSSTLTEQPIPKG